jgi:hypothetical protein
MKKLYLLAPNMATTKNLVNALKKLGIRDENTFIITNDHRTAQQEQLHEAELDDTSDLYGSFKRGLMVGGALGIVAGFACSAVLPAVFEGRFESFLLVVLMGAALGAWASAMIGVSVIQPAVEKFEEDIDKGKILLMAGVSSKDSAMVKDSIQRGFPEVYMQP